MICGGLKGWTTRRRDAVVEGEVEACLLAAIPEELLQRCASGSAERETSDQRDCLEDRISGDCSWMIVAFSRAEDREEVIRSRLVERRVSTRLF